MKFSWSAPACKKFGLLHTPGKKGKGLGTTTLHAGGSSGYMAVNLAYFLGASKICLLGFDMQYTNGQVHWFGKHKNTGNPSEDMLSRWVEKFEPLHDDLKERGIELVNCTRETALTVPRESLEACLKN